MQSDNRNKTNKSKYDVKSLQKAADDTKRQNKIINNSITDSCTNTT